MITIQKRENLFPDWTSGLLDTSRILSPRILDCDGGFDVATRIPSVNITENKNEFKIEMAAPGLERKDFKVEIENDALCISSEKEQEEKEEDKNYTRREYSYSSFKRTFSLPDNCITDKIDAKYDNGILNITLPKKENGIKPAKEIKVS